MASHSIQLGHLQMRAPSVVGSVCRMQKQATVDNEAFYELSSHFAATEIVLQ